MIFVQQITDGRPSNSGAEQDNESEGAFMNKKRSLYSLFPENCILSLWLLRRLHQSASLYLHPSMFCSPAPHLLPPTPQPRNKFLICLKESTLALEPSPTVWERYVTNQGSSLPVGSSQYCGRKPPVHSDKLASICAAHNLSCPGTGPSGLAGITATTHPQPLLESQVKALSRSGCSWARTREGKG